MTVPSTSIASFFGHMVLGSRSACSAGPAGRHTNDECTAGRRCRPVDVRAGGPVHRSAHSAGRGSPGPSSVIAIVCSKCAASEPSRVTTVQLSAAMSTSSVPRVSIGSIARQMPGLELRGPGRATGSWGPAGPGASRCRCRGPRTGGRCRSRPARRRPRSRPRCRPCGCPAAPPRCPPCSARRVVSTRRAASAAATVAHENVRAASACQPSWIAPDVHRDDLARRGSPGRPGCRGRPPRRSRCRSSPGRRADGRAGSARCPGSP